MGCHTSTAASGGAGVRYAPAHTCAAAARCGTRTFGPDNTVDLAEAFAGKLFALTPAMSEDLWIAGVAIANEPGYTPLPTSWCRILQGPDAYDVISDYLDSVNRSLGVDDLAAMKIIANSMRAA